MNGDRKEFHLVAEHIDPGKTFVYEFELRKSGTFMYHPHSDEMVQMAMGMMGMFVVHPCDSKFRPVDRDFVFVMSSYLIEPGSYLPKVNEMTEFNMWTWNSRVFPGIDPLPVRLGDRVRVRMGNLTMTNHPIHLHGHQFSVTCTDGGWVPDSAQWPGGHGPRKEPVGQAASFCFRGAYVVANLAGPCPPAHPRTCGTNPAPGASAVQQGGKLRVGFEPRTGVRLPQGASVGRPMRPGRGQCCSPLFDTASGPRRAAAVLRRPQETGPRDP
jgi:FtsP/CotA-like multicopper oxidase with cupredoxin domain